jgi:hypothetical protein
VSLDHLPENLGRPQNTHPMRRRPLPLIARKLAGRRRPHDRAHPRTEQRFMKLVIALASILVAAAAWAAPAQAPATLKGEVLETQNVDIYTYLRLKTKDGEIWAAVPTTTVKKGAEVTIGNSMVMHNFESKTLKKTFDKIVFGQIVDPNAAPKAPTAASPHGAGAPAVPSAAAVPKVAKAMGPDAKTVAEVVKGKAALKDKPVLVRGQVVKVNLGIMGKNWVHLQDGSGSAADGTNDILVTTKDVAAIGDIVNAKGTVRTDVNVGPGYAYAVLIEDAAMRK